MKQRRKITWQLLFIPVALILLILTFVRLPYYVERPGEAKSINSIVTVENGYPVRGDYRLVYIYVGKANLYEYLWAKFDGNKYTTLVRESHVKMPYEDDEAYNLRQKNYMTQAQQSASYVAYKAAGKKPELQKQGVLILDVMPSMPSARVLRTGDRIIGLENKRVLSVDDLNSTLHGKKIGERVRLTIIRGEQIKPVTVKIARFPESLIHGGKDSGIGIIQSNQIKVHVNPPVQFNINNIGGPSAGLMMTLEIYDQLTRQDLAKNRHIAGTGTMEINGQVGPIGGIADKVVGATKSGADLFFAPVAGNEAKLAQKTAKEIGSKMKIVPVATFSDAVNYLKNTK
ncbi:PDZ domain-containing protein [Sporolactobacillus sp. THM7-4]|nr:PDZ domain-containing protein [Sporolactobacillus sp. THM7-4]